MVLIKCDTILYSTVRKKKNMILAENLAVVPYQTEINALLNEMMKNGLTDERVLKMLCLIYERNQASNKVDDPLQARKKAYEDLKKEVIDKVTRITGSTQYSNSLLAKIASIIYDLDNTRKDNRNPMDAEFEKRLTIPTTPTPA